MGERIAVINGQVVTGDSVLDADILVEGDKIAGVLARRQAWEADRTLDAAGCYVFPGIVDAHTHIQLNTGIYKTADNWEIGTRAAAFGGVTTVIDFANQIVGAPFGEALAARRAEAADAVIDHSFHMVILDPAYDDERLRADLAGLVELGIPSIKLFTTYRPNYYLNDAQILRIFRAMPGEMIAMVHCENDDIVTEATQRLVAAGKTGWEHHGESRPPEAEGEAVNRILYLHSRSNGSGSVYIVHCSTWNSVQLVADYKRLYKAKDDRRDRRLPYCETCPQYLVMVVSAYSTSKPEHFILQPPLRADNQLLQRDVESIDVLSTDSCDYSIRQKRAHRDFTKTPGGLPGVETLLPLAYSVFRSGMFLSPMWEYPLPKLIKRMTENPAKLFGLYPRKGTIQPGSDADLVIYDPQPCVTIRHQDLHYVAGYSPYEGLEVQGRVRTVLSRGEVIVDDGVFYGKAGRGQFLHAGPSMDLR